MIPEAMVKRGLRIDVDRLPCGVRAKYIAGCRCEACRRSNTEYERQRSAARRAGDWNGIVSAVKVRNHLKRLRRAGVGLRAVAAATDVNRSLLQALIQGKRKRLWARNERRILRCTSAAAADRALVPANRAWRQIRGLLEEGFTKRQLSKLIGQSGNALQLGPQRITARNAFKVEKLAERFAN